MRKMEAQTVLWRIPLFRGLPADKVAELVAGCRRKRFAPKEPVVLEGDAGNAMYAVLRGKLAVSRLNEVGVRVQFHELGPGEFFGEMSLLGDMPRIADVIAQTACELVVIERDAFVRTVLSSSDLSIKIITHLCHRLKQADDARTFRRPARQRLVLAILSAAEEVERPDGKRLLVVEMTRQKLSELIVARRETVSREISQLAADGLLRVKGRRIFIVDPERLRSLCD
jgi:CRP-like cAMP-binding protein